MKFIVRKFPAVETRNNNVSCPNFLLDISHLRTAMLSANVLSPVNLMSCTTFRPCLNAFKDNIRFFETGKILATFYVENVEC